MARTDAQVEKAAADAAAKAAADKAIADKAAADATAKASTDPIIQGLTDAIVKQFGLEDVYNAYLAKDFGKAQQLWLTSSAYKNFGASALANAEMRATQSGVVDKKIQQEWLPVLRQYATDSGLQVTDEALLSMANKSFDLGLNVNSQAVKDLFKTKLDEKGNVIPNPLVTGITGGSASIARQSLATANADYGTGYSQEWIDAAATSIATGATTQQYWTDQMKSLAKSKYSAWGTQIDSGLTMKQIASPYIQSYANILGIDPASITLEDKLLNQALQGNDPTKPSGMPLWEFEKAVRKDPRWANSKDAMDSLSNTGSTILRQWGLMS